MISLHGTSCTADFGNWFFTFSKRFHPWLLSIWKRQMVNQFKRDVYMYCLILLPELCKVLLAFNISVL